ncbi:tRNA (adenosine(37)-N6)-threonylcarbamoyltransferase complex dimerization subunit type 1 TsaB [Tahibacter amnicola]|uniref:tRNA threonylcarbamoyladenosine biosynthesis protein TsaB n=1 Tax=Tahibacter amnicola TaxID=2976241 RepID=A0ABY6BD64_9GAMM|nr:tRNA (adenosine(37)-N6)-threonylcarbamoyltransferase complex dimerization subunit type 1 TsaB [Tahibacter amnicola]UXI67516.1 tRNA (adenosine(37)-N6)-threonylcarbamoyltransferase complex dimerization subunit type 1 TsaB [Tahibacter amnicola]
MNLIAIETSTECCSVALSYNGRVIERSELAPRRHAELVLPMADSLLAEAGLSRRQLDAVAVGRGPGAFTGVRLAVSVAQGMALGLGLPVVPISSLAALALDAPDDGNPVLAVIDARMGEVYAGAFRHVDGSVVAWGDESVGPADQLVVPPAARWNVIGSGWTSYSAALAPRLAAEPAWVDGSRHPQARAVARLAVAEFGAGHAVAPELALPVYLRDKVALTLTEQREARGNR